MCVPMNFTLSFLNKWTDSAHILEYVKASYARPEIFSKLTKIARAESETNISEKAHYPYYERIKCLNLKEIMLILKRREPSVYKLSELTEWKNFKN